MPPAGFEPVTSTNERPQTWALDGAAAGTDEICFIAPERWIQISFTTLSTTLSEKFLILRTKREMIKNVYWVSR
jgi:hypothetical protein